MNESTDALEKIEKHFEDGNHDKVLEVFANSNKILFIIRDCDI